MQAAAFQLQLSNSAKVYKPLKKNKGINPNKMS